MAGAKNTLVVTRHRITVLYVLVLKEARNRTRFSKIVAERRYLVLKSTLSERLFEPYDGLRSYQNQSEESRAGKHILAVCFHPHILGKGSYFFQKSTAMWLNTYISLECSEACPYIV